MAGSSTAIDTAETAKESQRGVEEAKSARGGFIGPELSEGEAGVIVDGDVQRFPAGAAHFGAAPTGAYDKLVAEKTAKGYTPGESGTPYQHTDKSEQVKEGVVFKKLTGASSPELNPCEGRWDVVKDEICNRVHATVAALRQALRPVLRRSWEDAAAVRRRIGRDWLLAELNATRKRPMAV